MDKPKFSVFVISWNRLEFTKMCLEALFYTTRNLDSKEIIVIDNGSTDGTPEYLIKLQQEGKITPYLLPENKGCGYATNEAMSLCKGDYIVEVDNDIALLEGWWQRVEEVFNKDAVIGQIGLLPNPFSFTYVRYDMIDIAPPNVAGAWAIRREIYDKGARWCEKSWKEEPWQAKLFSDWIRRNKYIVGNLTGKYAVDMADGNHKVHEDYYRQTFKDRGIEPLLDKMLAEENN